MEFDIKEYATPIMKNGKRKTMVRIELPNEETIKTLRKK